MYTMNPTNENCIDILLATYNGEKYIKTQLYSILYQDHTNWKILIHDDGSTDNTVKIIKEFAKMDNRIILIEDGITGLGPGNNFIHLLSFSTSPFICFADQDDIWFENKLSSLFNIIKKKDNSCPQIVCCNFLEWNDGTIHPHKLNKMKEFNEYLFQNGGIQGCACMFNRRILKLAERPIDHIAMHDHYIGLIGLTFNAIEYYDKPLFFYRRHATNVTGLNRNLKSILKSPSPVVKLNYQQGNIAFYKAFKNELSKSQKKTFQAYIELFDKNLSQKLWIIIANNFKIYQSNLRLIIKLLLNPFIES